MITLREGYMRLDGEREGVFAVLLISPYLLLGLFAWWHRRSRRQSITLFLLTLLLVSLGLLALASEAAGYRAALAESSRGPDYMRDRYQRMELFIVPALQWIVCLMVGMALLLDACWKRTRSRREKT